MIDKTLLLEANNSGIFDSGEISEKLNIMKREKVMGIHSCAITHVQGKESRWQTYILEDGNRKKLSATSEKRLIEKLYEYYFDTEKKTLKSLFPEWLEKRKTEAKDMTVRRNINHWDKYYVSDDIINVSLSRITTERIEKFLYGVIDKYQTTTKELNNMRFIIKDMLQMAKRKNYISENPYNDVSIKTTSCRVVDKHKNAERIYLPEEKEKLFLEIRKELSLCPDCTDSLGILLLFKFGLRIGELVALKWSDIDFEDKTVHIRRMETRTIDNNGKVRKCIVEHTKKNSPYGNRFLPLSNYEIDLFNQIKKVNADYGYSDGDFVFCRSCGRTGIRAIDNRIRKLCNRAGIPEKSAHDIRRTVASEMFNNGVNVEMIRDYLGQSDIQTTYGYIYNVNGAERTKTMLVNALSGLNASGL